MVKTFCSSLSGSTIYVKPFVSGVTESLFWGPKRGVDLHLGGGGGWQEGCNAMKSSGCEWGVRPQPPPPPIVTSLHFVTTQEIKLRWFQYRILHRILITNTFALNIKIIDNDLCTFCNENKESIEDSLFECNIVQTPWNRFLQWLLLSCKRISNIQLYL